MVTIVPGSFYLFNDSASLSTNSLTGGVFVEIHSAVIEYDLQNEITAPPIPVVDIGSEEPFQQVVDIKRIQKSITVKGVLEDDNVNSKNATSKRDDILTLLEDNNGINAVWGPSGNYRTLFGDSTTNKIFINKVKFTESAGVYGDAMTGDPQPHRKIDVHIVLFIGQDL